MDNQEAHSDYNDRTTTKRELQKYATYWSNMVQERKKQRHLQQPQKITRPIILVTPTPLFRRHPPK